jgi:hypothetical protein
MITFLISWLLTGFISYILLYAIDWRKGIDYTVEDVIYLVPLTLLGYFTFVLLLTYVCEICSDILKGRNMVVIKGYKKKEKNK